jgi:hypothetical protein
MEDWPMRLMEDWPIRLIEDWALGHRRFADRILGELTVRAWKIGCFIHI